MTRLKDITFASGSLTGATDGADSITGTVTLDSTSQIHGVYSARITASTSYLQENFTAVDSVYVSLYVLFTQLPSSGGRLVTINDASGNVLARLVIGAASGGVSSLELWDSSAVIAGATGSLSANVLYRLGLRYTKSTGSNGIIQGYVATGNAAFGSPFNSKTNNSTTTQAGRVLFGNVVNNSQAYWDTIRIDDAAMPGPESVVTIPAAPSGLTASAASSSQINLTWTDNATDETAYTVERSPNGTSSWTVLTSTLPANTASYSSTGLTASTTYYYRVKATNSAGSSSYSNTANATTSASAPTVAMPILRRNPAQVALWDAPGGKQLADLSARLTQATMETDAHGCASLAVTARMPAERAFALISDALGAHVTVALDGGVVWSGRVEEPGISLDADTSELTLTAYGYQQAFDDIPYTALWSKSDYDGWYPWQGGANLTPEKYTMDTTGGRLFTGLKGASFLSGNDIGAWRYDTPAGGSRNITTITFDAAVLLPTNWKAQLISYPGFTTLWDSTGNGALQTFTGVSLSVATPGVFTQLYNNTGATATITNDSQYYFRLTNVKLSSGTVTGDAIVTDMLSAVRAVNPSQLSSTTSQIRATELTLPDEVYLDANMRDVLDTIAGYGTGETPPQRLAWRVWADQVLRLETLDSGSTTYTVSVGAYQADRALRQTYPQVYASYQDSAGQRQVTATASASTITPRIIRRLAVQSQSTTSAQAVQERDAALADQGDPLPRVSMTIARLTDANGARVPNYRLREGDVVQVRDLAPTLSTRVDRFRSFRVIHTSYNLMADTVDVELEAPQPRLDWLLARRGIGL